MARTVVLSDRAPVPVAAYSQAVRAGDFLFLSGQLAIDPQTGELLNGTIETETRRVLDNLRAVLEAGGATLADVVKVTVYLTDMRDFGAFNTAYLGYFAEEPPARSTVAVAALPRGARIEIDAIAALTR